MKTAGIKPAAGRQRRRLVNPRLTLTTIRARRPATEPARGEKRQQRPRHRYGDHPVMGMETRRDCACRRRAVGAGDDGVRLSMAHRRVGGRSGRAGPIPQATYQRAIILFDGNDPDAIDSARDQWKEAQGEGFETVYWQQDKDGRT